MAPPPQPISLASKLSSALITKTTGKHDFLSYGYTKNEKFSSVYFRFHPYFSDKNYFLKRSHSIGIDYKFTDIDGKIAILSIRNSTLLPKHPQRKLKNEKMKNVTLILLLFIFIAFDNSFTQEKKPYYGYFPSEIANDWKRLQHNIIGFAVDIPSTWTFGINGQPPAAAALLYPEAMNLAQLSAEYGHLEIGTIPIKGISLIEAAGYTLKGMRQAHPNAVIIEKPKEENIAGRATVTFSFSWLSKTGFTLIEKVKLLEEKGVIYSLTIRATQKAIDTNSTLYEKILRTFKSVDQRY